MLYCKQAEKLPRYIVCIKESKNAILYKVFNTIWTPVCTCQNGDATPLLMCCLCN